MKEELEPNPGNSIDNKGLLVLPDPDSCNPSVVPNYIDGKGWPILVRVRQKANNSYGEASIVKAGYLFNPTTVVDYHTLIGADESHSKMGREDARIVEFEGRYYITSVGWDGKNARVILDSTDDLRNVQNHGVISCQIPLLEAIEMMGDERYKTYYKTRFRDAKESDLEGLLLQDKDAALEFLPDGRYGLWHRWEPGVQFSVADSLEDFSKNDYWENQLRRIGEVTQIWPLEGQRKVGLGGPPINIDGKRIGTLHYLEANESEREDVYTYYGSFFMFDPTKVRVTSVLKDALFVPKSEDATLVENHKDKKIIKKVEFPSAMIRDRNNEDILWVYYGLGDKLTGWRTTSAKWLIDELEHDHNKLHIERDSIELAA
jgi:predicted GH43/DUF377 family glycosyl hydrolase